MEDHHDPLGELRRLLGLRRAYARADAGDQLAAAGDLEGSLAEYEAAHREQPDNLELAFWHGVALAANGREEEALRRSCAGVPGASPAGSSCCAACRRPASFPDDERLIARLAGTGGLAAEPRLRY